MSKKHILQYLAARNLGMAYAFPDGQDFTRIDYTAVVRYQCENRIVSRIADELYIRKGLTVALNYVRYVAVIYDKQHIFNQHPDIKGDLVDRLNAYSVLVNVDPNRCFPKMIEKYRSWVLDSIIALTALSRCAAPIKADHLQRLFQQVLSLHAPADSQNLTQLLHVMQKNSASISNSYPADMINQFVQRGLIFNMDQFLSVLRAMNMVISSGCIEGILMSSPMTSYLGKYLLHHNVVSIEAVSEWVRFCMRSCERSGPGMKSFSDVLSQLQAKMFNKNIDYTNHDTKNIVALICCLVKLVERKKVQLSQCEHMISILVERYQDDFHSDDLSLILFALSKLPTQKDNPMINQLRSTIFPMVKLDQLSDIRFFIHFIHAMGLLCKNKMISVRISRDFIEDCANHFQQRLRRTRHASMNDVHKNIASFVWSLGHIVRYAQSLHHDLGKHIRLFVDRILEDKLISNVHLSMVAQGVARSCGSVITMPLATDLINRLIKRFPEALNEDDQAAAGMIYALGIVTGPFTSQSDAGIFCQQFELNQMIPILKSLIKVVPQLSLRKLADVSFSYANLLITVYVQDIYGEKPLPDVHHYSLVRELAMTLISCATTRCESSEVYMKDMTVFLSLIRNYMLTSECDNVFLAQATTIVRQFISLSTIDDLIVILDQLEPIHIMMARFSGEKHVEYYKRYIVKYISEEANCSLTTMSCLHFQPSVLRMLCGLSALCFGMRFPILNKMLLAVSKTMLASECDKKLMTQLSIALAYRHLALPDGNMPDIHSSVSGLECVLTSLLQDHLGSQFTVESNVMCSAWPVDILIRSKKTGEFVVVEVDGMYHAASFLRVAKDKLRDNVVSQIPGCHSIIRVQTRRREVMDMYHVIIEKLPDIFRKVKRVKLSHQSVVSDQHPSSGRDSSASSNTDSCDL